MLRPEETAVDSGQVETTAAPLPRVILRFGKNMCVEQWAPTTRLVLLSAIII